MARDYLCDQYTPDEEMYWSFICTALRSRADMCIIPLQDYLGKDDSCRMNKPSTIGTNWRWRVTEKELSEKLKKRIRQVTQRYGRGSWQIS